MVTVGPKMIVAQHIADLFPGETKRFIALKLGGVTRPEGGRMSANYGIVDRAIRAGLIRTERTKSGTYRCYAVKPLWPRVQS